MSCCAALVLPSLDIIYGSKILDHNQYRHHPVSKKVWMMIRIILTKYLTENATKIKY